MRAATDDDALRDVLVPTVQRLFDRHLAASKPWLPHEWVPWSRGRDFAGDSGQPWHPEQSALGEAARAALALNLLTEDNLPSYHHELLRLAAGEGPWTRWVRRWTAEEARHATSLRDYALTTRAVDPVALERDRMAALEAGWSAGGKSWLRALVYATLQELATRIAHRATGIAIGDPAAERLMGRIAADENLHMAFYRDLVAEALAIAPEPTLVAIAQEVKGFALPGAGLPSFLRASVLMADAGIYDARIHRDQVVLPTLRHWQALTLPVQTVAARQAQLDLAAELDRLDQVARRFEQRRAASGRRLSAAADPSTGRPPPT